MSCVNNLEQELNSLVQRREEEYLRDSFENPLANAHQEETVTKSQYRYEEDFESSPCSDKSWFSGINLNSIYAS